MKWIKSYTKFRLDEKVIFNDNTIKRISKTIRFNF